MTQSLAARLQEKLSEQTAEITAMTDSELKKLSEHVTQSVSAELNGIEIVIARSVNGMTRDLPRLKWIVGATWAALIVSLVLVSYSVWRWNQVPERAISIIETERDSTINMIEAKQRAAIQLFAFDIFRTGGWDYVIIPAEKIDATCPAGITAREGLACLRLPTPKRKN